MSDPNAHIPTAEVERDIADTEAEIVTMKQELVAWEALPHGSSEYLMAHKLRIPNARNGIKEREAFIAKLRGILALRSQTYNAPVQPTCREAARSAGTGCYTADDPNS